MGVQKKIDDLDFDNATQNQTDKINKYIYLLNFIIFV